MTDAVEYGLGLEPNVQRLVPHHPLWARAFAEEVARLRPVLAEVALGIEHYGSTAVPGLEAKPIIDIQVGVDSMDRVDALIAPMVALGYDSVGSAGIPEHHIFGLGVARTHLVHIVVFGGDQWRRTLRFRDRLRAEPELRDAYQRLKRSLVASATSRAEYTAGKNDFVERESG